MCGDLLLAVKKANVTQDVFYNSVFCSLRCGSAAVSIWLLNL